MNYLRNRFNLFFVPCAENGFRPRFLDGRFLIYAVVVLGILKILAVSSVLYIPKTTFFADISSYSLIEMANKERLLFGLNPLKENDLLDKAAYLKAKDMLEKGYFSHKSPDGKSSWSWIRLADYDYEYAGENLAIGFLDAGEIHRAWLASPTHRANIMNSHYTDIGIAVLRGNFQGNDTFVVVQMFGSPRETPIVAVSEETSVVSEEDTPHSVVASSNPVPEETNPIIVPEEVKGTTTVKEERGLVYNVSRFMADNFNNIVQFIVIFALFLVVLSLIINVLVRFDVQFGDLLVRASVFAIILIIFVMVSKETVLAAIPHNFAIY